MGSVNCYSCGFLGKYVPESKTTPKFFEIVQEERMNGKVFTHYVDTLTGPQNAYPVCFRGEKQVHDELLLFRDAATRDRLAVLPIINKDRECRSWCEYTPAFDPKEHLIAMKFQELDDRRKEFEQTMHN